MTIVDRETRSFLAIQAVFKRSQEVGQKMLDQAPAEQYYSDKFPIYSSLTYRRSYHLALSDKSETYSVEADNAELRHYLTRLARRSRCFSRCIEWLLHMRGTRDRSTIVLTLTTRSMLLNSYAYNTSHSEIVNY